MHVRTTCSTEEPLNDLIVKRPTGVSEEEEN